MIERPEEMTLRDQIAMSFDEAVICRDISPQLAMEIAGVTEIPVSERDKLNIALSAIARIKYAYADAMLEARKNGTRT
jgi:hypothetical protein